MPETPGTYRYWTRHGWPILVAAHLVNAELHAYVCVPHDHLLYGKQLHQLHGHEVAWAAPLRLLSPRPPESDPFEDWWAFGFSGGQQPIDLVCAEAQRWCDKLLAAYAESQSARH